MTSLEDEDINQAERLGEQSSKITVGDRIQASVAKKMATYQPKKHKRKSQTSLKWCIGVQCLAIILLLAILGVFVTKNPQDYHTGNKEIDAISQPKQAVSEKKQSEHTVEVIQITSGTKNQEVPQIQNRKKSIYEDNPTSILSETAQNKPPVSETIVKEEATKKSAKGSFIFEQNKAQWPPKPPESAQNSIWSISYEDFYPNGPLNLWDISQNQKRKLLASYQALPESKKTLKDSDFMQINYNKDKGFLKFSKSFESESQVIDWSALPLTDQQKQKIKYDFGFALKERLQNLDRLIHKYKTEYWGKTGYLDEKKEITYDQFVSNLEYQKFIGQDYKHNEELNRLYQREKTFYENTYKTDQLQRELHACIIAPTYNNDIDYRFAWHLESILQQDYDNYRVIIIDDASSDLTSTKIAMHLRWRNAPKDKFILIKNKKRKTALENIYYGIHKYCDFNQISLIVDGDDTLAGAQVFNLLNSIYQRQKFYFAYTNYFDYDSKKADQPLKLGISERYPSETVKLMEFREQKVHSYSHLRTMVTDLFFFTQKESFLDANGNFYWTIYDNAMYFPALEMSCGKLGYEPQLSYWYTANTGINDWRTTKQKQYRDVKLHIQKTQKHYHCIDNVFKKMHWAVYGEAASN